MTSTPVQDRLEQQKKEREARGEDYSKTFKPQRSKVGFLGITLPASGSHVGAPGHSACQVQHATLSNQGA